MKNMRFARLLCGVLMAGLLASCMGMEDVDPSSLSMPEVENFQVKNNGSLMFELSAVIMWTSDSERRVKDIECAEQYHVFHTVMNSLSIDSEIYDHTYNIFK